MHDFTLRFAEPPFVDPACKFVVIDPDPHLAEQHQEVGALEDGPESSERGSFSACRAQQGTDRAGFAREQAPRFLLRAASNRGTAVSESSVGP